MSLRSGFGTSALRLGLLGLLASADAQASDFWAEAREPGLAAHRHAMRAADVAFRARRFDEAVTWADRAIAHREDRAEGHRLRALALGHLDRLPEALPALERALALDPAALDEPVPGADAARMAMRAERWSLAGEILARVVRRMPAAPSRQWLYAAYADVLQTLGPARLAESVRAYEIALRHGPGVDPHAALGLALALHRGGEHERAAALLAQVPAERLDAALTAVAGPAAERSARSGLMHAHGGRRTEAVAAWGEAAERPEWAEHARAQQARLGAREQRP